MNHYCLVSTAWGTCGLVAQGESLAASYLPFPTPRACRAAILDDFPELKCDERILPKLRAAVRAYFAGSQPAFRTRLWLNGSTGFQRDIIRACRKIPYGETWTYAELALRANHPDAARAAGGVMARNRFPLIVPCHRVVAAGGKLGGFSGPGGVAQKIDLLAWERGEARR